MHPHVTFRHVLIVLALLFASPTWATHIVGGDLGYEFIGETAPGTNMFRYKLKVRIYLNCGASSNFPTILTWLGDQSVPLRIGVYTEDLNNTNGSKEQYTIGNVYVTTWNVVTPDLPEDCILGEGDCVEESLFEGDVILPLNDGGYHLYLQGFARNGAITNLVESGQHGHRLLLLHSTRLHPQLLPRVPRHPGALRVHHGHHQLLQRGR